MTTETALAISVATILTFANVDGIVKLNELVEDIAMGRVTEVDARRQVTEEAGMREAFNLLLNRKKFDIILKKELSHVQLDWIRRDIPKVFSVVKCDIPDDVIEALKSNSSIVNWEIFGSEGCSKMKSIISEADSVECFTAGYMSVDNAVDLLQAVAKHADSVTTILLSMITGKDLEGKDLSQLGEILSSFTRLKSLGIKSNTPLPVSVLEVLRKMPLLEKIQVNSAGEEVVRNIPDSVKKVIFYRKPLGVLGRKDKSVVEQARQAAERDRTTMCKAGFEAEHSGLFKRK